PAVQSRRPPAGADQRAGGPSRDDAALAEPAEGLHRGREGRGAGGARAGGHRRMRGAARLDPLGRSAAARRDRPGAGTGGARDPRRRADRLARSAVGAHGHGYPRRHQPAGRHHRGRVAAPGRLRPPLLPAHGRAPRRAHRVRRAERRADAGAARADLRRRGAGGAGRAGDRGRAAAPARRSRRVRGRTARGGPRGARLNSPFRFGWASTGGNDMIRTTLLAAGAAAAALTAPAAAAEMGTLNFGIISTESTQNLKKAWDPFLADMQEKLGMEVKAFFAPDYAGIIQGMRFDKVDVAWFGNKSA